MNSIVYAILFDFFQKKGYNNLYIKERTPKMKINIPEKHREEFDRAADFAVNAEKFTVKELAASLSISELTAAIMVGYMEKAGLVTEGKSGDVRRARIDRAEWERLDKKIENYEPKPEPVPEVFLPEAKEEILLLSDILSEPISFYKKRLWAEDSFLVLEGEDTVRISVDDVSAIFLIKPGFFRKGALIFSPEKELSKKKPRERADTLLFSKKNFGEVLATAERLSERLSISLIKK